MAINRVFETLSVATTQDPDYYLPRDHEEMSASIYIYIVNGMTSLMSHYPRLFHFMGDRPDLWVWAALSPLN